MDSKTEMMNFVQHHGLQETLDALVYVLQLDVDMFKVGLEDVFDKEMEDAYQQDIEKWTDLITALESF